jgi:hypothetical protein
MRAYRVYDSIDPRNTWLPSKLNWFGIPQETAIEIKRDGVSIPVPQKLADDWYRSQGQPVDYVWENDILRRARMLLGREGRFDAAAARLAQYLAGKPAAKQDNLKAQSGQSVYDELTAL